MNDIKYGGDIFEKNPVVLQDLIEISNANIPWEKFKNKSVFVAGGSGLLGSYLVKSLLFANRVHKLNLNVICNIRRPLSIHSRMYSFLKDGHLEIFNHDISKPFPKGFPVSDFIIHAASQASPKYYGVDPVGTLKANSIGTANLLEHAKMNHATKFLFLSSGEIYGIPKEGKELIGESDYGYLDPLNARSCYAESKRMGETMCIAWGKQYNIDTVIVRPFHTYGPTLDSDDGRVFADFVSDVVNSRDIVLKSDGLAIRPFCYITDATIAMLLVLLNGISGEAYNMGNPYAQISMKNLAELLVKMVPDKNLKVTLMTDLNNHSYLKSSVDKAIPAIEKIKLLGWYPRVSLEEGFHRTIKSFQV